MILNKIIHISKHHVFMRVVNIVTERLKTLFPPKKWTENKLASAKKWVFVTVKPSNDEEEKIWLFHKKFEWGVVYLVMSWFLFFVIYPMLPRWVLFSKYGISYHVALEILLFFMLMLLINTYFRLIKKLERKAAYRNQVEVSQLFIGNVLSLFAAYAFITLYNILNYSWVFRLTTLPFDKLAEFRNDLDMFSLVMANVKLFYLLFIIMGLHIVSKYFESRVIQFQQFVLVILGAWTSVFVLCFSNLLVISILLDALSFIVISMISLSSKKQPEGEEDEALLYSTHYFGYAVSTTILGYVGLFLLYTCTHTFEVTAIVFMGNVEEVNFAFDNNAFIIAGYLLSTKFLLLLGAFPFQQYIMEACKVLNYSYLFFLLALFKFPAFVMLLVLMKVLWIKYAAFQYFILISGLSSVVFGAAFILQASSVKDFLGLSSINQVGVMLCFLSVQDVPSVYSAVFALLIYLIANAAMFLLLASSRVIGNVVHPNETYDIDTWLDLRRFIRDSHRMNVMRAHDGKLGKKKGQYHYLVTFVVAIAAIALGGLPPLGGLFVKWSFLNLFLAKSHWGVITLVVLASFFSSLAYVKIVFIMSRESEKDWEVCKNGKKVFTPFTQRVSTIGRSDALFGLFCFVLLIIVTIVFVWPEALWNFIWRTSPFFYDNGVYAVFLASASKAVVSSYSPFMFFLDYKTILKKFRTDIFPFTRRILIDILKFLFISIPCFYIGGTLFLIATTVRAFKSTPKHLAQCWGAFNHFNRGSRFIGNDYKWEFTYFLTIFTLLYVQGVFLFIDDSDWVEHAVVWWRFLHLIIANFVCWYAVWRVTSSILLYRAVYLFYCFIECYHHMWNFKFWMWFYLPLHQLLVPAEDFKSGKEFLLWHAEWWRNCYSIGIGLFMWAFVWLVICALWSYYIKGVRYPGDEENGISVHLWSIFFKTWWSKYWLQYYWLFIFFFIFGPGATGIAVINHTPMFFLISFGKAFKLITLNFLLVKLTVWVSWFIYAYTYFVGIQKEGDVRVFKFWNDDGKFVLFDSEFITTFKNHCNFISTPSNWTKDYVVFIKFCIFALVVVWLPLSISLEIPIIETIFFIYCEWLLKDAQMTLPFVMLGSLIGAARWAFSVATDSEKRMGWAAFTASLLSLVFFVNAAIAYNRDITSLPSVGAASNAEIYVPLHAGYYEAGEFVGGAELLVFGYDYQVALLCAMTSFIFAFVFLISLFNNKLSDRKLFYALLLTVQVLVLAAFLSLNILGFIICFESAVLPTAVLIGRWGSSDKKWFAAKQFLVYSLVSSLPLSVALVYMYRSFGTLNFFFVLHNIDQLSYKEQFLLWACFFATFAAKTPLFPLHSWLLNAHVEAQTGVSIVLAAVLLKLGLYGFMRYSIGLFHDVSADMYMFVGGLALISIIYSSIASITETDAKRLIAHTSIAHMAFVVMGLFTFDFNAMLGTTYMIIGHGIITSGLFFLIGILYDRFHTRDTASMGGLASLMPLYSVFLFYFVMANAGFPWSLSFLGEMFLMVAVFKTYSLLAFIMLVICFVCLLYSNLRLFSSICFGTLNPSLVSNSVSDLSHLEFFSLSLLVSHGVLLMIGCDAYFYMLSYDLSQYNLYTNVQE